MFSHGRNPTVFFCKVCLVPEPCHPHQGRHREGDRSEDLEQEGGGIRVWLHQQTNDAC
jgi:hypothetical protein